MISTTLSEKPKAMVQGISFRPDQWAYIEAESTEQMHGNKSRIVQDAIDLYRQVRAGQVVVMPARKAAGE